MGAQVTALGCSAERSEREVVWESGFSNVDAVGDPSKSNLAWVASYAAKLEHPRANKRRQDKGTRRTRIPCYLSRVYVFEYSRLQRSAEKC